MRRLTRKPLLLVGALGVLLVSVRSTCSGLIPLRSEVERTAPFEKAAQRRQFLCGSDGGDLSHGKHGKKDDRHLHSSPFTPGSVNGLLPAIRAGVNRSR
jgi:hypothetical protein